MANLSTSWINSLAYANGSIAQFQLFMNSSVLLSDTFTAILHRGNSRPDLCVASIAYQMVAPSASLLFLSPQKKLIRRWNLGMVNTNTSGKHVSGLNLTEMGNLVLFDTSNATVWQSFDHPTDSLVFGQTLNPGQTLTASVSTYNSRRGGMYSLAVDNRSLIAYIESNPPQVYFDSENYYIGDTFVKLGKGRYKFSPENTIQFIKLEPDGHLKMGSAVVLNKPISRKLILDNPISDVPLTYLFLVSFLNIISLWSLRILITLFYRLDLRDETSSSGSLLAKKSRGTPSFILGASLGAVIGVLLMMRKNLDRLQPEEDKHLLSLFQRKVRGGQLSDMVDKCSEDMQLHGPEIVKTMRLAAWCLQSDFKRRPSMSTVVKVLEGSADVESDLDYSFVGQHLSRTTATVYEKEDVVRAATPLLPSVLSGPR
ncbi:unnamed protein product [Ilex paraguariensis]|uniref:Bulb-type lectin domain-containing protein n=1 Tax=Ilex paraguariensis TaxID=185542 RepID=A0ABC8SLG2_9AQUA